MQAQPTRKSSRQTSRKAGCLVAFTVFLVAAIIGGYFFMGPIRAAKQTEQELLDRYATVPEYTPAADGSVAPARMEIFLAVRSALLSATGNTQETFARLNENMTKEDLSTGEGVDTVKDAMSALPRMVEFYQVRNSELLTRGMGLGEYFYIYALAYGDRLCPAVAEGGPEYNCEFVTPRTTREMARILRNQLENPAAPPTDEMAKALRREINGLEHAEIALPWQEGLPAGVAAALAPYRLRLEPLFCEATRELELGQKNKHVGGIAE